MPFLDVGGTACAASWSRSSCVWGDSHEGDYTVHIIDTRRLPSLAVIGLMGLLAAAGCSGKVGEDKSASTSPSAASTGGSSAASDSSATGGSAATSNGSESPAATAAAPSSGGAAACATDSPAERPEGKLRLVVGTGGTGGVFFPYGGGVARVLTDKMTDVEATAEVTGGSVDNLKLLGSGDIDLGFTTVDSAVDAMKGAGAYTEPITLCAVASLYTSFVHVVASADSGITSVDQLNGKVVSVGSAGSSAEVAADRVMEVAGVDTASLTRENLGAAESVAAMKDGKLDAFFWVGGLPTAAVTDLTVTDPDVVFLDAGQYVDELAAKYGEAYQAFELPAGTYEGVDEPVPGIGVGNLLVTSPQTSSAVVNEMLTTLFDNLPEVQAIHPEAASLTLEGAAAAGSVPYHPGALEFFESKGVPVGS